MIDGSDYVTVSGDMPEVLPGFASTLRLTVLQPARVAYAAVGRLALYVSLLSAALVVGFVAAGSAFARSLSRPILSLRQLSEDIVESRIFPSR